MSKQTSVDAGRMSRAQRRDAQFRNCYTFRIEHLINRYSFIQPFLDVLLFKCDFAQVPDRADTAIIPISQSR